MYQREKPMSLKSSTSAVCNNLSIHISKEKKMINYAVAHKSVVNLVSACMDGSTVNHRQVVCKEPSTAHAASIILQTRIVDMPGRAILVIAAQNSVQMYEAEDSVMMYNFSIADQKHSNVPTFARGICSVGSNIICVGNHDGHVYVFKVPTKGTNVSLAETLRGHSSGICDLNGEKERMVSSDEVGNIVLWGAGDRFRQISRVNGMGYPCSSIGLYKDAFIASYGSGHLRVYNCCTGNLHAEAAAHGRWITAIDVAQSTGLVATVGEDCFLRIWQMKPGPEIEHLWSERLGNIQLQGVQFITPDGRALAVTGYDSNEIIFYKR